MEKEEILLEYYRQTIEDCRLVGELKFKMLISIAISLGGILYAAVRINEINPFYSLNRYIYVIIFLFGVAVVAAFWTLLFLFKHLPIINNIAIKIEELQRDILFQKMDEKYLFCWDEIPGNDNEILKRFLTKNFNVKWVKKAKIEKNDNNMVIKIFTKNIFTENKSLSLKLNDEKTTAILTIDDITDKFDVKIEADKLKIYEPELKYRFREIYPHLNAYNPSIEAEKKVTKILFLIIVAIVIFVEKYESLIYLLKKD